MSISIYPKVRMIRVATRGIFCTHDSIIYHFAERKMRVIMRMFSWIVGLVILVLIGWTIASIAPTLGVEKVAHTLIEKRSGYEIREYPSRMVAQVVQTGDMASVELDAHAILAGFFFGGNSIQASIPVTAPTISMVNGGRTTVAYFIPNQYTGINSIPKPNDPRVELLTLPAFKAAVYTVRGSLTEEQFNAEAEIFLTKLKVDGITPVAKPLLMKAYQPWTIWFMKKNEVVVIVK